MSDERDAARSLDEAGPVYIFAGGGTGGHLAPALAVARLLARERPGAKLLFACTQRAIDRRMLEPTGYGLIPQPVRPIPRNPLHLPGFVLAYWRSQDLARDLVRDVRPSAVLGLGGFAAAPVVREAARRGIPAALLNPDSVPGKANRYLARHVRTIFTQFAATRDCFGPADRGKVRHVGCPIRPEVLQVSRAEAQASLGLEKGLLTLSVMGGSLGAEGVNQAVLAVLDLFARRPGRPVAPGAPSPAGWQVVHITGVGKSQAAGEAYRQAGVRHVVMDFCDRMGAVYAASDLVIGRAGANTVAELTATGTPAVLLPYPHHRDQHQRRNAEEMAAAGAAVLVEDMKDVSATSGALREALGTLVAEPSRLTEMARAARGLGRPDAAAEVAKWLLCPG